VTDEVSQRSARADAAKERSRKLAMARIPASEGAAVRIRVSFLL
jgi:hypothetical protein